VGRDAAGQIGAVTRKDAWALLCNDRRGVWLQAGDPTRGVHVNGRRIRRMAMVRAGDALFAEGVEMIVLGDAPAAAPGYQSPDGEFDARLVLRGVGGQHHGRSLSLDSVRTLGRARECDIRIDDAALGERHLQLLPHAEGLVLRCVDASAQCQVNGHAVREALLKPGDQLVVEGRHRFVVESPSPVIKNGPDDVAVAEFDTAAKASPEARARKPMRVPWLLVAAALLAGGLSLLLLYGAR